MPAGLVTIPMKDGNGTTRNFQFMSSDGTTSGTLTPVPATIQNTNPNGQATKSGSTPVVPASDWAMTPYALPADFVSGATGAITDTTATAVLAAAGSGLRNYVTTLIVSNSHATVGTDVQILDGTTVLLTIPAAAVFGGAVITLPTPVRGSINTAINAKCVTTGASVKVSAVGFKGA